MHGVRSITWAPDCSYLASAGDEEIIRIWDPLAKRQVQMLGGRARRVVCVSWSPDGSKLASVGDDESVRVWEPSTGGI